VYPKLNLINNYKLINISFLSIPIIFLFPVNISNIFCILYLTNTLYFFKKNNLKIKIDILDKIFFLFFLIIVVSSLKESFSYNLTKENLVFDIISKIGIVRFFFIYLLTKNILQYNLVNIKSFLKVSVICTIFISLNIILMHIVGYDLFGNKSIDDGFRFATTFGERLVAGTYLLNFFFFSLLYFYYCRKNNLIKFFFIFLIGLSIFLTNDRAAVILFLIFYFFLCLLNFKKDYRLTIIIISLLPIFFVLTLKNEKFFSGYHSLIFKEMSPITQPLINKTTEDRVNHYGYLAIYKDSINTIFFEKTTIGSGKSSFYSRCKDYRLKNDPKSIEYGHAYACPKHTHNLYLEILIAGGLLGVLVLIVAIITKLFLLTKNILLQKPSFTTINSILILGLIIEVFPLRPYGEIFNSYNGLFFFFKISIIYGIIINQLFKYK